MLPSVPTGFDGLQTYLTNPDEAIAAADRIAAGPRPDPKPTSSASPPVEAVDRDGNGFLNGAKKLGGLILGIGVLVAVKACVYGGTKAVLDDSPSSSYDASTNDYDTTTTVGDTSSDETESGAAAEEEQAIVGVDTSAEQSLEDTSYASADEESEPMAGYATLTMPELQYCLAEDIRMTAYKSELDSLQYVDSERFDSNVDDFNAAVRSYNNACSNRQFMSNHRSIAEANVNGRRYSLESEGRRRVR